MAANEQPPPSPIVNTRAARVGEMCTCGREAREVQIRADGREVPYCRTPH